MWKTYFGEWLELAGISKKRALLVDLRPAFRYWILRWTRRCQQSERDQVFNQKPQLDDFIINGCHELMIILIFAAFNACSFGSRFGVALPTEESLGSSGEFQTVLSGPNSIGCWVTLVGRRPARTRSEYQNNSPKWNSINTVPSKVSLLKRPDNLVAVCELAPLLPLRNPVWTAIKASPQKNFVVHSSFFAFLFLAYQWRTPPIGDQKANGSRISSTLDLPYFHARSRYTLVLLSSGSSRVDRLVAILRCSSDRSPGD